jgi:hypothetical protein
LGKLIAGGDSFIYGDELHDCLGVRPSDHVYPALIAKEIGMEYVCAAGSGYSNASIRRTVMNACESNQDIDLVLVQWSFACRYEFYFDRFGWNQIGNWHVIDDPEEIKKEFKINNPIVLQHHIDKLNEFKAQGITDFAKIFFKKIALNMYYEQYNFLSEVVMLQQYLENKKIPYMFASVNTDILRDSSDYADQSFKTLEKLINKKDWMWFPKQQGFYRWAEQEKFPFGTTHPLEEAHLEAAHLVYEHLRYISRLP